MRRTGTSLLVCAMVGLTLGTAGGCGKNITADTTLAELLDQITVGDVVNAFQQFAAAVGERRGGFGGIQAQLTDEQRAQVEALQAQLDAGEITREQFVDQVHAIIGDALPNEPFVGFGFGGGPFGGRHGLRVGGYLDLTQEQVDAATQIFEKAHTDITALRTQAQADILAVLTDEQRARLDELVVGLYVGLPLGAPDAAAMTRAHGRGGHGGFGGGGGHAFDRFADALELTEDQRTQIETIRQTLTDAIRARHELARDEFLALLTPEQLAKLPGNHGDDDDDDDDDEDDDAD